MMLFRNCVTVIFLMSNFCGLAHGEIRELRRDIVYKKAGEYAAFPTLGVDKAGLYLEFSVRGTNSHFERPIHEPLTFRSTDLGNSWKQSTLRGAPSSFSCGNGCISMPVLPGWHEQNSGMKEQDLSSSLVFRSNGRVYISGRPWIKISEDAGASWRKVQLNTKQLSFVMNYNSSAFTVLPTGVKLLAVYGRRVDSNKTEPFILRSVNGKDWNLDAMYESGVLADVAGINETALLALGGKRVLAVGRAEPDGVGLYFSTSEDEGASWSRPKPLGIPGYPANLVDSPTGIILTYGYRKPPMGIRLAVLDRQSLEVRSSHTLTRDAVGRPSDVGYPVTLMVGPSDFITAYYTTGPDGVTQIEALKWRFEN